MAHRRRAASACAATVSLRTALVAAFLLAAVAAPRVDARPLGALASAVRQVGSSFFDNFDKGTLDSSRWRTSGWWSNGQPFNCGWDPGYWTIDWHTLSLSLKKVPFQRGTWNLPYTAGEIRSVAQYNEGCYSVCMKAAPQSGTSSSFYIQNFAKDAQGRQSLWEIDVEMIGKDHYGFQTNFFARPYDPSANSGSGNEQFHKVNFDVTKTWSTYSFRWRKDRVDWWVNDQHVRVQFAGEGNPAIPDPNIVSMEIAANVWPVNKQAEEWAGPLDQSFTSTKSQYAWIHHDAGPNCKLRFDCGRIYGEDYQ